MSATHASTSAAAATSTNAIPNLYGGPNPATPKLAGIVCGSSIAFAWLVCFLYWWRNRRFERQEEAALLEKAERGEKPSKRGFHGETRARAKERREKNQKAKKKRKERDHNHSKKQHHHKDHHGESVTEEPSSTTTMVPRLPPITHDGLEAMREYPTREDEQIDDLYRRGLLTR